MCGFVELDEAAADAEDQRDLHVHAPFLDDGCTAAVLVDRVAGEAEGFHVTALGDLLVEVVADHADAVESEGQIVCFQLAGECPHQAEECGHRREAVSQGAGDGVGVLHAQPRQDQQAVAEG